MDCKIKLNPQNILKGHHMVLRLFFCFLICCHFLNCSIEENPSNPAIETTTNSDNLASLVVNVSQCINATCTEEVRVFSAKVRLFESEEDLDFKENEVAQAYSNNLGVATIINLDKSEYYMLTESEIDEETSYITTPARSISYYNVVFR